MWDKYILWLWTSALWLCLTLSAAEFNWIAAFCFMWSADRHRVVIGRIVQLSSNWLLSDRSVSSLLDRLNLFWWSIQVSVCDPIYVCDVEDLKLERLMDRSSCTENKHPVYEYFVPEGAGTRRMALTLKRALVGLKCFYGWKHKPFCPVLMQRSSLVKAKRGVFYRHSQTACTVCRLHSCR